MSFRRAARIDANQNEIVDLYRSLGALVVITSQLKKFADIVICYESRWYVIEIKDGSKFPKKFAKMSLIEKEVYAVTKLTPDEKDFYQRCQSLKAPYYIVWDKESALRVIGL